MQLSLPAFLAARCVYWPMPAWVWRDHDVRSAGFLYLLLPGSCRALSPCNTHAFCQDVVHPVSNVSCAESYQCRWSLVQSPRPSSNRLLHSSVDVLDHERVNVLVDSPIETMLPYIHTYIHTYIHSGTPSRSQVSFAAHTLRPRCHPCMRRYMHAAQSCIQTRVLRFACVLYAYFTFTYSIRV